jgi:thioredoxin 1
MEKRMINEPIHVNDDAFEKMVMQSEKPVVVDFWAPWCGPCRVVAPILDKFAGEYADQLVIAKVNTDENPMWAQQFGVQGIPTMIFVAEGKLVHRQVGALPEPMLRDLFDQFVEVTKAEPEAEAAN